LWNHLEEVGKQELHHDLSLQAVTEATIRRDLLFEGKIR